MSQEFSQSIKSDKRLSTLEQNLTMVKTTEVEFEKEYETIDQNVTEKELMVNLYREIDEVSLELDGFNVDEKDRKKLDKIKK